MNMPFGLYDVLTWFLALSMLSMQVHVMWVKIGPEKLFTSYAVKNITWWRAWGCFNVTRTQTIENIPAESLLNKRALLFTEWQHNTMLIFTMSHKFTEHCLFTTSYMTARISVKCSRIFGTDNAPSCSSSHNFERMAGRRVPTFHHLRGKEVSSWPLWEDT